VNYYAWADQDEIFAVDGDGWFRLYQFENVTSRTDTIEISKADSVLLPSSLRSDPVWAASDFRAADVGDRDSDSHRLNGAVVFFNPDNPNDNMAVFHDGSEITFLEDSIQIHGNLPATTAVCVGEYNYPVHHTTASSRRGSLISHGEPRILVCFKSREDGETVDRARIFAWNYTTEEFDDVTGDSLGLLLDIEPVKAVWGVFWPTYSWWDAYYSLKPSGAYSGLHIVGGMHTILMIRADSSLSTAAVTINPSTNTSLSLLKLLSGRYPINSQTFSTGMKHLS
jgi:hypothetical protein